MTAKLDTSLATHAEFQECAAKSRPAVTKMLWRLVLKEMNIVAANGGNGVRLVWQSVSDPRTEVHRVRSPSDRVC